jgi:hypothetical protein
VCVCGLGCEELIDEERGEREEGRKDRAYHSFTRFNDILDLGTR